MFARTERLLLRPGWIEDAPALARAIGDEAVVRNLATAPWPYALGDAETFLSREPELPASRLLIFARTGSKPRLVGGIGISPDPEGKLELGYWVARPYWGLGFATEAGRALLAAARHSLRLGPVIAGHFTDNPGSGRVLQKLGFQATGRLGRRYSAGRGAAADCVLYEESDVARQAPAMRCLEAA